MEQWKIWIHENEKKEKRANQLFKNYKGEIFLWLFQEKLFLLPVSQSTYIELLFEVKIVTRPREKFLSFSGMCRKKVFFYFNFLFEFSFEIQWNWNVNFSSERDFFLGFWCEKWKTRETEKAIREERGKRTKHVLLSFCQNSWKLITKIR